MTAQDFPIRLDDTIRTVPWELMEQHKARAVMNHGVGLATLAAQGGLTPEQAVAIIENRGWERMPMTAATLRLKQLVDEWKGRNTPALLITTSHKGDIPLDPEARRFAVLENPDQRKSLAHGRAIHAKSLAKDMRDGRRAVSKPNWNELITALEGLVEFTR